MADTEWASVVATILDYAAHRPTPGAQAHATEHPTLDELAAELNVDPALCRQVITALTTNRRLVVRIHPGARYEVRPGAYGPLVSPRPVMEPAQSVEPVPPRRAASSVAAAMPLAASDREGEGMVSPAGDGRGPARQCVGTHPLPAALTAAASPTLPAAHTQGARIRQTDLVCPHPDRLRYDHPINQAESVCGFCGVVVQTLTNLPPTTRPRQRDASEHSPVLLSRVAQRPHVRHAGAHAGHKLRYELGASPDLLNRVCTADGAIVTVDVPRCVAMAATRGERCRAPTSTPTSVTCSKHAGGCSA